MEVSGQLHGPAALPSRERAPDTDWIGGRVVPRAGLYAVMKRKSSSPCKDLNPDHLAQIHKLFCTYSPWNFISKLLQMVNQEELRIIYHVNKECPPPVAHVLVPWNRILLEKLNISQLFKKFPTFYETRKFITLFLYRYGV